VSDTLAADLTGVPETMLWTLHNRASEALRADGWLRDEEAVRIYRAIPYDYESHFGRPDSAHATRSLMFDEVVSAWMRTCPGGTVVELGCGLETEFQRIDDGLVRWLCVDVPEAIAVRERFLPADGRCRLVAKSAFDLSWMEEIETPGAVFVTGQGLFMYFDEAEVGRLFGAVTERFPGVEVMFDVIPPWLSRKSLAGWWKTRHYRAPPMPWGVRRGEIEPLLRAWCPQATTVRLLPYRRLRGFPWVLFPALAAVSGLREQLPWIVHLITRAREA
jgi:O-methyltransferase involved in polyketide biosynthesis